jgi:peptidyl-tRNA hydrolase, PTH1 family
VKAVVGLRNPGPEYELTRHNVGFEVVQAVAEDRGERLGKGPSRTRCETADLTLDGERVVLAAPITYMNESGRAVRALTDYFGIGGEDLLVLHDDIDLPFGRLRIQQGGGTGGHNGLRSIEKALGHREFTRLKVGVGRPPGRMDPADFVLRRFTRAERAEVDLMVAYAAAVVEEWAIDVEAATRRAGERKPA